jgi:hypothetical protein
MADDRRLEVFRQPDDRLGLHGGVADERMGAAELTERR